MKARVIQVIEVQSLRGMGIPEDVLRNVFEYFSFDGEKLSERDPWMEERKLEEQKEQSLGESE